MNKKYCEVFIRVLLSVLLIGGEFFIGVNVGQAADNDIKINEVMFNPTDSVEWVELYNGGTSSVDLNGWSISDEDSSSEYVFSAVIELPRDSYLVIRSDNGTDDTDFTDGQGTIYANHGADYANGSDQVALYDGTQQIIDFIAWGGAAGIDDDQAVGANIWTNDDYVSISDLSPGNSLGLIVDGDDNDDSSDWQVQPTPTPGQTNIVTPVDYSEDIRLNEILPNPATSETTGEYIELYNNSSEAVDLAGWQLGDSSSTLYTITAADFMITTIATGGYVVIYRDKSKIALNNSGDTVKLYQPDQTLLDSVTYAESAEDDTSYNFADGSWQWSTQLTPGAANQVVLPNDPPKADAGRDQSVLVGEKVKFDTTNSSDPDGDTLTCSWDFSDGSNGNGCNPTHTYNTAGTYTATLTVSDGRGGSDTDTVRITVLADNDNQDDDDKQDPESPGGPFSKEVVITEFLPNPEGSDTAAQGEFIEIYNQGKNDINLHYWYIDDIEGGSKPYQIEESLKIKSKQYHAFYRGETKLSLNNSDESARLIWPDEKTAQEIHFDGSAKEGSSYALGENDKWHWTTTPTPGQVNKINEVVEDDKNSNDNKQDSENYNLNDKQELISAPRLSIQDVRAKERYDKVKTVGIVTAPPKVLSESYLYVQDSTSGIQVYSSKKDFPDLKLGDEIEINGKISEAAQEKRILISSSEDIKTLASNKEVAPVKIQTGKTGEDLEGKLVLASGQLERSSGNISYINDGSGTLKTYIQKQTDITKPKVEKGKWITYQGIISQTSTGYRLMPRYDTDVKAGKFSINPSMGLASIPRAGTNYRITILLILLVIGSYYLYPQIRRKIKNN